MLDIRIPTIVVDATSYSPSMVSSMCRPITCVTAHLSLHRGDGYCRGIIHNPMQVHLLPQRLIFEIRDCASNLGEGDIAARITQGYNRDEGVGSKAGDDVGMLCQGGEGRDVVRARVHGVYALTFGRRAMMGLLVGCMLVMRAAVMRK
jgi:hypothetical protein